MVSKTMARKKQLTIDLGMGWKTFENVKFPFFVVRLLKAAWASSLTFVSVVALLANVPVAQTYLHTVLSVAVQI